MGKQILIFRALLVLLLFIYLTLISSCQTKQQIPINSDRDITLVTIRIGNTIIPNILLDTGFPFEGIIIYNPSYRDSIDLSGAASVSLGGAGSGNAQQALMIDSAEFFLGSQVFTNQRIIVLQSDIYKGFPTNGIIGYSFFGYYAVEIDYEKNLLTLHNHENLNPDTSWSLLPLYFKGNNIPWIDATVSVKGEEGIKLSTYIDFADRDNLVLLEKPIMKFDLPVDTTQVLLGRGLSGDIYGKKGMIAKLKLGPYILKNITVSIAKAEVRSKQKDADAVLGSGILRNFNLIFDYKGGRLFLKPNSRYNSTD